MNYWLFQANDGYDLTVEIPNRMSKGDYWHVHRYRDKMQPGDKVVLWHSGAFAGIYGIGMLSTAAYEVPNKDAKHGIEWRIGISYSRLLNYPLYSSELRRNRDVAKFAVFLQPYAANPFPIRPAEWKAILRFINKKTVNLFSHYQKEEDQFTNGLVGILDLSQSQDGHKKLLHQLTKDLLSIDLPAGGCRLRVLKDIEGTADAEICGHDHCIRIETKVFSGTLRDDQLKDHLKRLKEAPVGKKSLVLITPDDGQSDYISRIMKKPFVRSFLAASKHHRVQHLEWRAIYGYLGKFAQKIGKSPLAKVIEQYLEQIHDCIFEQDYAGVIQKISFGDVSEVYEEQYVDEMKNDEWDRWNTPRKYDKLDGTGRKLLLYDKFQQAITAEVEIQKVIKANESRAFPWTNIFVPKSLTVFEEAIPVSRVLSIPGFENFKSGRSSHWNVTREQYKLLTLAE